MQNYGYLQFKFDEFELKPVKDEIQEIQDENFLEEVIFKINNSLRIKKKFRLKTNNLLRLIKIKR